MKKYPIIRGSGGDDEEDEVTRTPYIAPDSLASISYLRVLDLICEGEIVGLVNGSKSIYLNRTPLQNDDDTFNFQNVAWTQRKGTQDQKYISGARATEREIGVGAEFKYGEPSQGPQPCNIMQTGTAIVRSIVNPELTSINIRISVPSLMQTNPTNGDTVGTSVTYSVWVKPSNAAEYTREIIDTIEGKSSSKYNRTRRINLKGKAPWLVRVQRETPDSQNSFTQNSTFWESYTEIVDLVLRYPNSALIGIGIDATQFNSVPPRIYEMDLLKIKIPVNYDDVTRTYTGIWNGDFKISTGACNNPAWVFMDLILSERYGLGQYIKEDQIDKWKLYEIARYCDELVDDGFGGQEPRFTCNVFIPGRTEAYNLLKSMASIFRGMLYWFNGSISTSQDAPRDSTYIYNQSNVVDGKFAYQGASAQLRHTVARVNWNDPKNFYESTIEYVEDQDGIKKDGVIETEVVAFGCTSRGQANRLGKWLLYTEKYEAETVTFSTGLDGVACLPGDVIEVSDPTRAGVRLGGRINASTNMSITLDGDVDTTITGSIMALLPNGVLEERTIDNISGRTVMVLSPFTLPPQQQGVWVIKSDDVEPQTFRVIGIVEGENGVFSITAIKHNPSKYDFIEKGLKLESPDISALDATPDMPKNLHVTESLYSMTTDVRVKATFYWDKVPLAANYRVSYRYNSGNEIVMPLTQFNEMDFYDVQPGLYTFSVVAINTLGKESPKASIDHEIYGKSIPPQDVENFSMIPSQGNALLSWDRAKDLDVIIGGYVRIRWTPRTVDQKWSDGIDITPALTGNSTQAIAPLLAGTYMVKFVDSSGNYSLHEKLIITNVADIYSLNRIVTIREDPDFSGTMLNMEYIPAEQAITLVSLVTMDMVPDIDGLGSFDVMGDIVGNGEYGFEDSINLTAVYPFKVRVNIDLEAYDTGNYFDQRMDLMDDWISFDGDVINAMNAQVHMRTTTDDPTGIVPPTWSVWKPIINAEYIAWGAEFKLVCTNDQPNHNFYIRELSVDIDMDDRTWNSGKRTSSAAGDFHVQYDHDFYALPSIGVTEENMNTGDYKRITNVTVNSFDISFYNSAGTRVVRDFYVLAKSYGLKLT